MPRERWFYAQDEERRGPLPQAQLVEALLRLPEPRSRLVWKRGLHSWTRASGVPEIAAELSRHLPEPAPPPEPEPEPAAARESTGPQRRVATIPPAPPPVLEPSALPQPLIWAGGALLLVAAAAVYFSMQAPEPITDPGPGAVVRATPSGGTGGAAPAPGGAPGAAPGAAPAAGAGEPAFGGWGTAEADMPSSAVAQLRGVAAWEGDTLKVTLYNGSRWRVTEILVRTSRLDEDRFVDSPLLHPLVPRGENVDTGVAQILDKVAPDRRRPAVNPDDTRAFEGKAGEKPKAYRWRIEAARGYPPLVQ